MTVPRHLLCLFAAVSFACNPLAPETGPVPAPPPSTDLLIEWNASLLAAAEAEDAFLTLKGLRAAAMLHLAVHDAMCAIFGRYRPYREVAAAPDADPSATLARSAFEVASAQYPGQRARWEALLRRGLERAVDPNSRRRGEELGRAAAARILTERTGDGWDGEAEYRWHPMAPGVYAEFHEHSGTPEGFVFGAGWASARPFVLATPGQFAAPPPPAIESADYTRAFREVKEVGAWQSPARSADQSHLALWWKDFVENSHNRLARQLVDDERPDLIEAARLFALLEIAVYDAYLDVFHNKFVYNHWRPYTAIRWAEHDGNPDTAGDPDWNNTHRHTYPFPTYPSAHGAVCGAATTVLASFFGDDHPFTLTTREVDRAGPGSGKIAMEPPTRSFPSFSAAADECGLSRVYLGIHFRYDSVEGVRLGRRVGRYVLESALRSTDSAAVTP